MGWYVNTSTIDQWYYYESQNKFQPADVSAQALQQKLTTYKRYADYRTDKGY